MSENELVTGFIRMLGEGGSGAFAGVLAWFLWRLDSRMGVLIAQVETLMEYVAKK